MVEFYNIFADSKKKEAEALSLGYSNELKL
jgi:hypothetical protein